MWKKIVLFLSGMIFLGASLTYAQNSAVSATVVDSDGTTWADGTWKIAFVPNAAQPNINVYNINGVPLSSSVINQSGTLDGSGNLALTVYQNSAISPSGSSWTLTVCPWASSKCGVYNFITSGNTTNLSSALTSVIPAPRFPAVFGSYGYTDGEAIFQLAPGSMYFNVLMTSTRIYTGSAWTNVPVGSFVSLTDTSPQTMAGALNVPSLTTPLLNNLINVDAYSGGDIGAKINSAVAACGSGNCTYNVAASGTISTVPVLPMGSTLVFNPTGTYNISCHWVLNHRGITILANGAHFSYTLADGATAIYIGKNINSVVNVSGSTVTWVSGSTFESLDTGDQISVYSASTSYMANVASATSTSITLTASLGTFTSVPMNVFMATGTTLGNLPDMPVTIKDLSIVDNSATATDTAIVVELTDNTVLSNVKVTDFTNGTCLSLLGALLTKSYALNCDGDGNGEIFNQNSIGGFLVTASNANIFYGDSLTTSTLNSGHAIAEFAGSGNQHYGLHIEGEQNTNVLLEQAGGNLYQFSDYERNGYSGSTGYELDILSNDNLFEGPSEIQSYNSYAMAFQTATTGNTIQNLQFNVTGVSGIAYNFLSGSMGYSRNNKVLAGAVGAPPAWEDYSGNYTVKTLTATTSVTTPSLTLNGGTATGYHGSSGTKVQLSDGTGTSQGAAYASDGSLTAVPQGTATLVSGTTTVSTASTCAVGSTCVYHLSRCAPNSSTAIGSLSIGTITAGTSFVINALSPTNTVLTGDLSTVCWSIN